MSRVFGLRCLAMLSPPAGAEDADACHDDALRDFEVLVDFSGFALAKLGHIESSDESGR